jgi:hypothetical protein
MTKQGLSSWVEVEAPSQHRSSQSHAIAMRENLPKSSFTVHTSLLFSPHQKKWLKDAAIEVDNKSGLITSVTENVTTLAVVTDGDIDLRGYTVVPGFGECCDGDDLRVFELCRNIAAQHTNRTYAGYKTDMICLQSRHTGTCSSMTTLKRLRSIRNEMKGLSPQYPLNVSPPNIYSTASSSASYEQHNTLVWPS